MRLSAYDTAAEDCCSTGESRAQDPVRFPLHFAWSCRVSDDDHHHTESVNVFSVRVRGKRFGCNHSAPCSASNRHQGGAEAVEERESH